MMNNIDKATLILGFIAIIVASCAKSPSCVPVSITHQYIEERIRPAVDEIVQQLKVSRTVTSSHLEELDVYHVGYIEEDSGEYITLFGKSGAPYDYAFMLTSLFDSPSNGIWVPNSDREEKVLINHNVSIEGLGHVHIAILIDNPGDLHPEQRETK